MTDRLLQSRWPFVAALALLFILQIVLRSQSDVNHNVAWYLYVANGLAGGKRMYRDFMEVNPPLAAWITWPLAPLARGLGAPLSAVFNAALFAVIGLSLVLSSRYLRLAGGFTPARRRLAVVLAALALLYFPAGKFGEREHILIALFLPWMLLRVARAKSTSVAAPEALAIGLMAALGVCLKPHALLAPLAVEMALLITHRDVRRIFAVENLAAVAAGAAYVVAVRLMAPEFFTTTLDLGVRAYVPFIGFGLSGILAAALPAAATLLCAVTLLYVAGGVDRTLAAAAIAASLGFLASYFLQAKGFAYQLLPAIVMAAVAALAVLAGEPSTSPPLRRRIASAFAVLLFVLNIHAQSYDYLSGGFDDAIAEAKPGARSVFIATTNLSLAFPFVTRGGYVWASRFPAQWLTPYVSTKWQGGVLPADDIVARSLDWTVTDLATFRPDVVIVDRSVDQAYVPGGRFDYLGFWAMDPRFAALWRDYDLRVTIGDFSVFARR